MSVGRTASGVTPSRASKASRRGEAEARMRRTAARLLLEAVRDPTLGEVVGRQLDEHLVADQHADAVLAHLAGGMAENLMIVLEADAEHGVGQKLDHLAAHLEQFFLGHLSSVPKPLTGGGLTARARKGKRAAAAQAASRRPTGSWRYQAWNMSTAQIAGVESRRPARWSRQRFCTALASK